MPLAIRQWTLPKVLIVALPPLLGGVSACVNTDPPGTLNPVQYCESLAALDCKHLYTCITTAEREALRPQRLAAGKDIGQSQSACTQNLKSTCAARPFTCEEGFTFQDMKAWLCNEREDDLTCTQVLANEEPAVECGLVCTKTVLR